MTGITQVVSPKVNLEEIEFIKQQEEKARLAQELKPIIDNGVDVTTELAKNATPLIVTAVVNAGSSNCPSVTPILLSGAPIVTKALQESSTHSGNYVKQNYTQQSAESSVNWLTSLNKV